MCSIVIIYYAIHLCLWLIFLLQLLTLNVWCLFQHHFSITNQAANFSSDANCPGLPSVSTSNGWSPMRWHPPQRPTKKSKVPTTPTLLSFYNLLEQLTDPQEMLHLLLPTYKAHIPGTAKEKAHIMQVSAEAGATELAFFRHHLLHTKPEDFRPHCLGILQFSLAWHNQLDYCPFVIPLPFLDCHTRDEECNWHLWHRGRGCCWTCDTQRTEPHPHHSASPFNLQVKSDIVLESGVENVKIVAQRSCCTSMKSWVQIPNTHGKSQAWSATPAL